MAVRKSNLRAVAKDEKPKPTRPMTLDEAIAGGDLLQILLAQRRDIAASLPDEKGPAKAALHRQFSQLSKDIEALQVHAQEEAEDAADIPDEAWDEEAI